MASVTQKTNSSDREILANLIGGLSIIPYGIYAIVSALAFALGWLDWETNGGPPFVGYFLALVFDKLISRYYGKRYGFSFGASRWTKSRPLSKVTIVVVIIGVIAWVVDTSIHFPVRLFPLLLGVLLCYRGFVWIRTSWRSYGWIHLGLGILCVGLGFLPLILSTTSNNRYLGIDGVLELAIIGVGAIVVGVVEHRIFLQEHDEAWVRFSVGASSNS